MKKRKVPLSRGWRIARNLAAAVLLVAALWAYDGFSLPTDALRFEWVQRGALMTEHVSLQGAVEVGGSRFLVGAEDENALIARYESGELWMFPRSTGPALVPLPHTSIWDEAWIMAVDVPEGTASARLEVTASVYYAAGSGGFEYTGAPEGLWRYGEAPRYWERSYEIEGRVLERGAVAFSLQAAGERENDPYGLELEEAVLDQLGNWSNYQEENGSASNVNCRMEATFYGEGGEELGRAALRTLGG